MKTPSSDVSTGFFVALFLLAFVIDATLGQLPDNTQLQQQHQQHQQQQRHAQLVRRQSYGNAQPSSVGTQAERYSSNNRQQVGGGVSGRNMPPQCDYKELMTNIHDRVGVLASLDEDQRNRLAAIAQKLSHFESSNMGRLESIAMQQIDFQKRLEAMEHTQQLTKTSVDELKGESEVLMKAISEREVGLRSQRNAEFSRQSRQTDGGSRQQPSVEDRLVDDIFSTKEFMPSVDQKLDALATLLTSTAANVNELRQQLQANLTKLSKATQNLNRRILGHKRHGSGTPHQGASASDIATNCFQADPTSDVGIVCLQLTPESEPFYARCEDDGWLMVLNRFSDNVNFERDWIEYKAGFGNLAGEFFIGLEKLHALTSSAVHELRVVVEDHEGIVAEAGYNLFAIGSESELYALNLLGEFNNGTAGDSLSYHAGSKFSTFDHDNDGCLECNCAASHKGGWWFNWCATSNLMGNYFTQGYNLLPKDQGMFWNSFRNSETGYSLKKAKLLIRPVNAFEESR